MEKLGFKEVLEIREHQGFSIFPVKKGEKRPAVPSWKKYQTEFATDEELQKWFSNTDTNIAVVTGKISGITVVDIDHKDPKKKTPLTAFPETYTVQTPSGGYHLYYKYTPEMQTNANQYSHLPYVDIRNDGGFVVAPPSIVNDRQYKVIKNTDIQPFPLEIFKKKSTKPKKQSLTDITKTFNAMSEGDSRNVELTKLAGKLISRTPNTDWLVVRDQIDFFNSKFKQPLDKKEVDTIYKSITDRESKKAIPSPMVAAEFLGAKLRTNSNNAAYKDMTNVLILLKSMEDVDIKYNTFKQEIEYNGVALEDKHILEVTKKIQHSLLPNISDNIVYKAIQYYAHENTYDEANDWLNSLEWDEKSRLADWLIKATGCEDNAYHRSIGAQWMVGMVKRITHAGCVFDHVLTAIGGQGVGKTSLFRIIGGEWYKPFTGTVDNKDFYLALRGAILIDLDEGSTMYKSDSIKIKSIITETVDEHRAPYARTTERHPRRFVFSMSTNDTEPFRDQTGNRRYLPFLIPEKVNFAWLEDNRDQIFAEAYDVVKNKRYNEVEEIPIEEAIKMQEERIGHDSWLEPIEDWLMEHPAYVVGSEDFSTTIKDLWLNVIDKDNSSLSHLNKFNEMRIGNLLRNELGFERKRIQEGGKRFYRYQLTKKAAKVLQEINEKENEK